jgi:CxxC motif-containing protein (DUF1111 family)
MMRIAIIIMGVVGCSPAPPVIVVPEDRSDLPVAGLSEEQGRRFVDGDGLFERRFFPSEGLGPVYIRASCGACHAEDARGPGSVDKVSLVDGDGRMLPNQVQWLPHGPSVRPFATAGASPVMAPEQVPADAPPGASWWLSRRVPPAVFARGYLEAMDVDDVVAVAAEQNARGVVSGRLSWVTYAVDSRPVDEDTHSFAPGERVLGRFGLKARIATLDAFVADALQGDMGLTSPQRPVEFSNPNGVVDDAVVGADILDGDVSLMADYMRMLRIPTRADGWASHPGAEVFNNVGCTECHVERWTLREDYPYAAIAGATESLFTDLLLHDMGSSASDGIVEGGPDPATEQEWKTPPLIGVRFLTSYLHDGRALTLEAALLGHRSTGSEANASIEQYQALSADDQHALLDFLEQL